MVARRWMSRLLMSGSLLSQMMITPGDAAIIYRGLGNQQVAGKWAQQPDDTFLIQPDILPLDLDGDQHSDLRFEHGYARPFYYMQKHDAELLLTARAGMEEVSRSIQQVRGLALDSANAGVNDDDSFQANQSELDNRLDLIDRIARNWQFEGKALFDGTYSVQATSADPNVIRPVRTTRDTAAGEFLLEIKTSAERAVIAAGTSQTAALAQDEILSINGTNIELFMGMTQDEVVNRINEYTSQTGTSAFIDGTDTALYSRVWGEMGTVNVISNQASASDSSGFGAVASYSVGLNAEVQSGQQLVQSQGTIATFRKGPAAGLSVELVEDQSDMNSTAAAGTSAIITVVDRSLNVNLLPNGAGEPLKVALPYLHSQSLAIGQFNNQFANLSEVDITSAWKAQDALAIIDVASNEVSGNLQELDSLLNIYYRPHGLATVTAEDSVAGSRTAIDFASLTEGQLIDINTIFSGESLSLEQSLFGDPDQHATFLGFRLIKNEETFFGWLRLGIDDENRMVLKDLAFESVPGRGIRVGFVPEPGSTELTLAAALIGILARRSLRKSGRFA